MIKKLKNNKLNNGGHAMKVMVIFGTRPETIKLSPLIQALNQTDHIKPIIVTTGQHKEMLQIMLDVFSISPDYNLDIMQPNQSLSQLCTLALDKLSVLIETTRPDRIVVQGDTTTAFIGSLAAFYHKVPVLHVEAGLRSFDIYNPWPEEVNRRLIAVIADIHCAPTEYAYNMLMKENIPASSIHLTGNTIIDALEVMNRQLTTDKDHLAKLEQEFSYLSRHKKLILVTSHRRESFGKGLQNICNGLNQVADNPEVEIIFPVHLNPNVRSVVHEVLAEHPNIHLIDHVDHQTFIYLLNRAYLVMTDSGGVQEESCALKIPTLVLRNKTERPESILVGNAILVGTNDEDIAQQAQNIIQNPTTYKNMCNTINPYGDGNASSRMVELISKYT